MATLSISNVPDDIVDLLSERARLHHRSLQEELLALVLRAVETASRPELARPERPAANVSIEAIAAEHRTRWPKPIDSGTPAVDIIRRQRDAR